MAEIKRILCPVDFYDASEQVASYCRLLAQKLGAEVVALYVAPRMNRYAELYVEQGDLERVVSSIVKGAKEKMETFVSEHFPGLSARGEVRIGYAPEEILQAVTDEQADLVVMGTHGRRGINHVFFGSVAERIVKSAPVPVLTVRPTQ